MHFLILPTYNNSNMDIMTQNIKCCAKKTADLDIDTHFLPPFGDTSENRKIESGIYACEYYTQYVQYDVSYR